MARIPVPLRPLKLTVRDHMRFLNIAFAVTFSLASSIAVSCKSPTPSDHLTSEETRRKQEFWVARVVDIYHGQVTVAATGEFGHLNEIGKPVALQFLNDGAMEGFCALHLRHGHTYLLRSVSPSKPNLLFRFVDATDSEDPHFQTYIQDLKAAHGR